MSNHAEAMMQDQIEGAQSENEALRCEVDRLRAALRLHHAERTKNSSERRKSIVTGGKGSGGVFGNLLEDAYMRSSLGTLTAELLANEHGA